MIMEEGKKEYIDFVYNGKVHKIVSAVHAVQSPLYHKYMKEGDMIRAHWLHIRPYIVPPYVIQARMDRIMLYEDHLAEMKRIKDMPTDLLCTEIEMEYGISIRDKSNARFNPFCFISRIFNIRKL